MMNRFSTSLALRDAERLGQDHATAGLPPDATPLLEKSAPTPPAFNPAENPLDQLVNQQLAYERDIEETRVRIEYLETQRAQYTHPVLVAVGIAFLFLFDMEANVIYFRNDGFEGIGLVVMSFSLVIVLFVLTYQLAKQTTEE